MLLRFSGWYSNHAMLGSPLLVFQYIEQKATPFHVPCGYPLGRPVPGARLHLLLPRRASESTSQHSSRERVLWPVNIRQETFYTQVCENLEEINHFLQHSWAKWQRETACRVSLCANPPSWESANAWQSLSTTLRLSTEMFRQRIIQLSQLGNSIGIASISHKCSRKPDSRYNVWSLTVSILIYLISYFTINTSAITVPAMLMIITGECLLSTPHHTAKFQGKGFVP